jgi:hypothetical protein
VPRFSCRVIHHVGALSFRCGRITLQRLAGTVGGSVIASAAHATGQAARNWRERAHLISHHIA